MHMRPVCLGYLAFEVSDLRAWERFAVDILGAQRSASTSDEQLAFRFDEHARRLLLHRGETDDIAAAGWEFASEPELMRYVAQLRSRGVSIHEDDGSLSAQRAVQRVFSCKDPDGWVHEFYFGPEVVASPCSTFVRGGFECGRLGVGHFVALVKDADRTNAFYKDVLDFSVTDRASDQGLTATFYHVGSGRHHSIAVIQMPGSPKRVHHFMIQARELEDVGAAYDRFTDNGIPIVLSMGQHTNDRMVSFYGLTPSGFAIEYGCGGVVVDDATWIEKTYTRGSLWGHRPAA
jgi:2,3-dihydroxybiphenyl 1,2-dioxygenase